MAIKRPGSPPSLTISNNRLDPSFRPKIRKQTAFKGGAPKPSGIIDNKPFSWNAVRGKSLSQRRTDRLDDTTKWLDSKGMLSGAEKKWLAGLSTGDKAKLTKLLKVNKYFSGGVKNTEDRHKIRAQVMLMAARSKSLDMAAIHRGRLTEQPYRDQPRLYKSLNEQSFFDPKQVAAESNQRRAQGALAARSFSLFRGSNDLGYAGPRLDKAKRTHQAVTSLLDKGLVDHDSATRLRRVLRDETHRVNILMNIDERQVPDKADRQKIRQAVLLRAAHFGTDEARTFKAKLLAGSGSVKVATPKVDKNDVRQDSQLLAISKDSIHPDNAPRNLHKMYVGDPNKQNVDFLDDDRALDLAVDAPGHRQLFPLAKAGDPDGAAREQWDAVADKDFDPRTGISAHGQDAAAMRGPIGKLIDHTLQLNNIHEDDFAGRRDDAMSVLQGVNTLLPENISFKDRSQALADAAAIFLQPTGKGKDDAPVLGNLDHAVQSWPKRQVDMMGVRYDDPKMHLEDAGFLKRELRRGASSRPIGKDYIFSPPLRALMDDSKAKNLEKHREESRPTLDFIFGDKLDRSGKDDAFRYTYKQRGFAEHEAVFRQTCLNRLQGDDRAEAARSMQPLQGIMGTIAKANPNTFRAADGGRQGPNEPKLDAKLGFDSSQDERISFDPSAPIVDHRNRPDTISSQAGMGSHKAVLGNILMSTFLQNYDKAMQEKFGDDDDDEIPIDEAKAKIKEAVNDAVKQTVIDCRGLENASLDDAQGWMERNKSDPSKLGTADNIDAGRFKGRRHTANQLRELNAQWKDDMKAPYDAPDRLVGRNDDVDDENRIIEVEE